MTSGWRARRAQARVRNRILAETDFSFMDWTGNSPGGPNVGPGANTPKTQQNRGPVQAVKADQALQLPRGENAGERERESVRLRLRAPLSPSSHGPLKHLDCLDHLDQASIGAGLATVSRLDCQRTAWTGTLPLDRRPRLDRRHGLHESPGWKAGDPG